MSPRIWLKLIFLLLSLTVTLFAIFWLKQGHGTSFWTSLGMNPHYLNWCEERVKSLYIFELKAKVQEVRGAWQWQQEERSHGLDYLMVEKWFAKYCQVDMVVDGVHPEGVSRAVFEVEFLNGEHLIVYGKGEIFEIHGRVFKSKILKQGLEELLRF